MLRYTLAVLILCGGIVSGVSIVAYTNPKQSAPQPEYLTITPNHQIAINQELQHLINLVPGSYQARLAFIHGSQINKFSTLDRYQIDIVANASLQGFNPGPVEYNIPISQWHDFLPTLIANRCPILIVKDIDDDTLRQRLAELGPSKELMGCPIRSANGDLQGGLFIHWPGKPSSQDIDTAYEALRGSIIRIQKILNAN